MLNSNNLDGMLVKQNEVSQDSYLCFLNVFEKTLKQYLFFNFLLFFVQIKTE